MSINAVWKYSLGTEAKRLIHTAHQISVYFYQINGFLLLPAQTSTLPDHCVIFPDLGYHTIPRFFDKAKKVNIDAPISVDKSLIDQFTAILSQGGFHGEMSPEAKELERKWKSKEKSILEVITEIIPETPNLLKSLTIYPTLFGTRQSFNRLSRANNDLSIYVRFDATVATIAESIVSALTRQFVFDNLSATWSEAEIIPDWLLTQSKLSREIEDKFVPTINSLRSLESHFLNKTSDDYFTKLGYPKSNSLLEIINGKPTLNGNQIKGLNHRQSIVLTKIIANGKITSDELADAIFDSENSYSLYAMSKFMQRLRDKLEANGITGSVIQTVRGYGYSLRLN